VENIYNNWPITIEGACISMKYDVLLNLTNHTCDWCNSKVIADYIIKEKSLNLTYHACNKHLHTEFTNEELNISN